jgi:hypothetical protein
VKNKLQPPKSLSGHGSRELRNRFQVETVDPHKAVRGLRILVDHRKPETVVPFRPPPRRTRFCLKEPLPRGSRPLPDRPYAGCGRNLPATSQFFRPWVSLPNESPALSQTANCPEQEGERAASHSSVSGYTATCRFFERARSKNDIFRITADRCATARPACELGRTATLRPGRPSSGTRHTVAFGVHCPKSNRERDIRLDNSSDIP